MERDLLSDERDSENSPKNDEEDILYTHKPESRGSTMQWDPSLYRRPGR